MGLSSTIIYTSELILCSTICVPSATRHNIHLAKTVALLFITREIVPLARFFRGSTNESGKLEIPANSKKF